MIEGNCSNKNCASRSTVKVATKTRKAAAVKKEPKATKPRKSSKVITYNLYENNEAEENIE